MYSQLTNTSYNKSLGPVTNIRVNDITVDGALTVDGRVINEAPTIVNSSNVAIPNPVIITGTALTVNGIATFSYASVGLTGPSAPTVIFCVDEVSLDPPVDACWAMINSIGLTSCSVSIFRVITGAMQFYNVSGVRISFTVIGSKVEV